MKIKFWGVRGSHPISDKNCLEYGGNTTCLSIEVEDTFFIIDAGTGLIKLDDIEGKNHDKFNLFFTHMHIDHIQGIMFFKPLYSKLKTVNLYGPVLLNRSFFETIKDLMRGNLFPVGVETMNGLKEVHILENESKIEFPMKKGKLIVKSKFLNVHPRGGVLVYRFSYDNKSFVFATDIESKEGGLEGLIEFSKDADLLIHDAQYSDVEYGHRIGWGHSTERMAIENARKSNVKLLCLTHYNSDSTDIILNEKYEILKNEFKNLLMAKEGLEIIL